MHNRIDSQASIFRAEANIWYAAFLTMPLGVIQTDHFRVSSLSRHVQLGQE
jgi:hypothetical protein